MARISDTVKKIDAVIVGGQAAPCAQVRYTDPDNPYAGLSYVAAEALYHLSGGHKSGLQPHTMHLGVREIHWYLVDNDGKVHDPTAKQFARKVDYSSGRPTGFMSPAPSARAQQLINLLA